MLQYAGVVVLYNPDKTIKKNIVSYLDDLEKLYVVDNSVIKNDALISQIVKIDRQKIEYIAMGKNRGIAMALNCGIEKAIKDGFQWLLTMDQDSGFDNSILTIYDDFISTNSIDHVAILSPQYRYNRRKINPNLKQSEELYWTMQSANLLNLEVVKEIGGFCEKLFIDCVDYEYCMRCQKRGYKIIRCNSAILNHCPAETREKKFVFGTLKYGYASPLRIYYQVRNALYMYDKYHNIKSLQIVFIKIAKVILLFDQKKEFFYAIKEGISDYRHGRFGEKTLHVN